MDASIMRHKGYVAGIRYSEEDGCLVGRILGISDIVSFHGDSVKEIRREFSAALDSYLSDCREIGKEPERSYSGRLALRLTPETHKIIALEAEKRGQSINDAIVDALHKTYLPRRRNSRQAPAGAGK